MSSYTIVAFAFVLLGNKVISWYRIIPLCYIPGQPSREIPIVNCGEFISTREVKKNWKILYLSDEKRKGEGLGGGGETPPLKKKKKKKKIVYRRANQHQYDILTDWLRGDGKGPGGKSYMSRSSLSFFFSFRLFNQCGFTLHLTYYVYVRCDGAVGVVSSVCFLFVLSNS